MPAAKLTPRAKQALHRLSRVEDLSPERKVRATLRKQRLSRRKETR